MNYVLLMMGGSGTRFGADIPKQFTLIDERPLFYYILKKLSRLDFISGVVVVVHADWQEYVRKWVNTIDTKSNIRITNGGATRSESVLNGLRSLEGIANSEDVVLLHDATHPYVDVEGTKKVAEMVSLYGAATLASLNFDTTYMMDDNNNIFEVIPRKNVIAGASPEGFKYGQIYGIYRNTPEEEMEGMTSAGALALANKIPMKVVPTSILNLKITYPEDMVLFKMLFNSYFFHE